MLSQSAEAATLAFTCSLSFGAPFKYSLIDLAALRPAPMARITVAPPVTMSPPAKTPGFEVARSSFAEIYPRLVTASPGVVDWINGFAEVPAAIIATWHGVTNSEPLIGIGLRRPESSDPPSSWRMHFTAVRLRRPQ